jgi:hypothetical protein
MKIRSKRQNIPQYAKELLAKDYFSSNDEKRCVRQSLQDLSYQLTKLRLQWSFVEKPENTCGSAYHDHLENLLTEVDQRICSLCLDSTQE